MSIFLKTDANVTSPLASMPYLEKDYAITRGVTKTLIDLSNPECYSGAGNVFGETTLNNLVDGGYDAQIAGTAAQYFTPVAGGMLSAKNTVGSVSVRLPTEAKFDSTVRRALVNMHFAFDGLGMPSGSSSPSSSPTSICGTGTGANTSLSWVVFIYADTGTGAIDKLQFRLRGASGNIDCDLPAAQLTPYFNGEAHQYGFAVDIKDGTATAKIFIDGVEKASTTGAMTQFNQVADANPSFFAGPAANWLTARNVNARIGRMAMHDLTNRSDLSFEDVLSKDRLAAAGYIF